MDLLKGESLKSLLRGVFSETTFTVICIGAVLWVFDHFQTKSSADDADKGSKTAIAELKTYADNQDAIILKEVNRVQVQVVDTQKEMVAQFKGLRDDITKSNTETQRTLQDIYYKLPRKPASQASISIAE